VTMSFSHNFYLSLVELSRIKKVKTKTLTVYTNANTTAVIGTEIFSYNLGQGHFSCLSAIYPQGVVNPVHIHTLGFQSLKIYESPVSGVTDLQEIIDYHASRNGDLDSSMHYYKRLLIHYYKRLLIH